MVEWRFGTSPTQLELVLVDRDNELPEKKSQNYEVSHSMVSKNANNCVQVGVSTNKLMM